MIYDDGLNLYKVIMKSIFVYIVIYWYRYIYIYIYILLYVITLIRLKYINVENSGIYIYTVINYSYIIYR